MQKNYTIGSCLFPIVAGRQFKISMYRSVLMLMGIISTMNNRMNSPHTNAQHLGKLSDLNMPICAYNTSCLTYSLTATTGASPRWYKSIVCLLCQILLHFSTAYNKSSYLIYILFFHEFWHLNF